MARFVDLDEDDDDQVVGPLPVQNFRANVHATPLLGQTGVTENNPLPAVQNIVTDAFQCYPVVLSIINSIDLNTLDSLSRTSRRIHDSLIQYRTSLLAATLRCFNDAEPVDREQMLRYRARTTNWHYMEDGRSSHNGKSGRCARDLVGECRRCSEVVCRNCAIKPPAPIVLRERHRRLCMTCARAPIGTLAKPPLDENLPLTSDAIQNAVCKCDSDGVWLCQPCGRTIRSADHEYQRIWRWRNHYGEVLGGLGTGIGEGDRGVICGREADCLRARDREQEIDCDAEDARDNNNLAPWSSDSSLPTFPSNPSTPSGPAGTTSVENLIDEFRHERTPSPQLGPGYARHEIEGIGGIVKRKLVRMVRVGACVPEWDDEKGLGKRMLAREVKGLTRSWCGWCWRVIPGAKDLTGEGNSSGESPERS